MILLVHILERFNVMFICLTITITITIDENLILFILKLYFSSPRKMNPPTKTIPPLHVVDIPGL